MTRFPACLPILSLCLVISAGAQTPAVPTLKANTKIVVIDVVVTDKQGNPVKNLKASDFALTENTTPQTISHFDAHTSLSAEDRAKVEAMPKLAPNTFTNYSPVAEKEPLTVLVFDALNTTMDNQAIVLKQMLKYLDTPHPGTRMELFELNSSLTLLQGFTSDQELLRAALMSRKAAPQGMSQFGQSASDPATPITMVDLNPDPFSGKSGSDAGGIGAQTITAIKGSFGPGEDLNLDRASEKGFQLWTRQTATLDAMAALARYTGGLPGRKNLLWFSASFVIPKTWLDVTQKLHETMALLARNQVVVYPIGARGLELDLNQTRSPAVLLKQIDAEYFTMNIMAEDTGGKVFGNSNDLAGAVEKAVDHGSNYYTLTYAPANKDWKGEFRNVKVKLAQKGYTLAYRPGYYAEDADKQDPKDAVAETEAATPDPPRTALNAAMEYGSPQPSDVVLKVAVNPATGQPENTVAKMNVLAPKVSAPFERYVLSVAALPQAFTFTRDTPGKIHMAARLVTRLYSADGTLINKTTLNVIGDIDDARYQTIMANGLQFKQEISVPLKGESFLRIGVEDLPTNRIGVVEIPVATVAKLKPLTTSAVIPK